MSDAAPPTEEMYTLDSPYEVARWRPLAQWILNLPHALIVRALQSVNFVVFLIYWIALLATGRLNRGLYSFMAMFERYSARSGAYLIGHTEVYPPFDFSPGAEENGAHPPVRLELPEVPEQAPRSAALNVLLAVPHYVVLALYVVAALIVVIIAWFAVLFTGRWPANLRDWLVRLANYYYRVWAYVVMATTGYPAFGTRRS